MAIKKGKLGDERIWLDDAFAVMECIRVVDQSDIFERFPKASCQFHYHIVRFLFVQKIYFIELMFKFLQAKSCEQGNDASQEFYQIHDLSKFLPEMNNSHREFLCREFKERTSKELEQFVQEHKDLFVQFRFWGEQPADDQPTYTPSMKETDALVEVLVEFATAEFNYPGPPEVKSRPLCRERDRNGD